MTPASSVIRASRFSEHPSICVAHAGTALTKPLVSKAQRPLSGGKQVEQPVPTAKVQVRTPCPQAPKSPRTPHDASSGRGAVWPAPDNMQVRGRFQAHARPLEKLRASYVRHRHIRASVRPSPRRLPNQRVLGSNPTRRRLSELQTPRPKVHRNRGANARSPLPGRHQIRGRTEDEGGTDAEGGRRRPGCRTGGFIAMLTHPSARRSPPLARSLSPSDRDARRSLRYRNSRRHPAR